jgi:hypothetical protein
MPPAETLSAVANSRNSLSTSARLLTKTGIAKGKRGHCRRSPAEVFASTYTSSESGLNQPYKASWGPNPEGNLKPEYEPSAKPKANGPFQGEEPNGGLKRGFEGISTIKQNKR